MTKNKLFCWSCLLFVYETGVWNKFGFCDLNNLYKVAKRQIMSKSHLHAVIKEVFGKTRIEQALGKQLEVSQKHKNREVLNRLIDVVCFLDQHELGFRGHDEQVYPQIEAITYM